jgi:hypothetical protein
MNCEKYIGLDVHQATISVAVMDSMGKLIMESILETKASTILEFLGGLRGTLSVTFEEGTWAAWLYDLLKPHVAHVVACNPRKNAALNQGNRSEKIDAREPANRFGSMISSRSTTARMAYACCANWRAVLWPSSKILPGS